jgi:hypothetical protein
MLDASHNFNYEETKPENFDPEKDNFDDFFREKTFRLINIYLGNNPNLFVCDLGENEIENLDFPPLPNLLMLSLRENNRKNLANPQTLKITSPKLIFLDYHRSNIKQVNHVLGLENPNLLTICNSKSYTDPDGTFNPDVATPWEELFNQLHSKRKAKKKGLGLPPQDDEAYFSDEEKKEPIITDPSQLTTDYPNFAKQSQQEQDIDISHEGLTGTMIIDGYSELRELKLVITICLT